MANDGRSLEEILKRVDEVRKEYSFICSSGYIRKLSEGWTYR